MSPPPPPSPSEQSGGLLVQVVRRPVAVIMVVLAVVVFGGVSLFKLPVNLLPDVSYPTLTVRTLYAGAAPADVEKLVTRRIEETLAVVPDLSSYRSISRAGVSDVILEFAWDTPMTFAAQNVRENVDQLIPQLPQEIERPLILRFDPTLDPIMRLALYAKDGEAGDRLYELRQVAEEQIRRRLENLPGVAAVRVRGGFEEEWRVELREDLLKLHGVSASQVAERVNLENVNVAGGLLRDGDRESLVRTIGEITTLQELEDLVVDVKDGRPIRVRNLGEVIADKKERDVITRVEGTESVEIEVFKEAGANVVDVAHRVKARLFGKEWKTALDEGDYRPPAPKKKKAKREKGGRGDGGGRRRRGRGSKSIFDEDQPLAAGLASSGIRTRLLSDQSQFIEASITEVRNAAGFGALLAIVVLFAFLRRLTPTLIISVSIPTSVIATFAPLFLSDVSLNIMSLGGLALGIGMLVDSSIVVLESITRRWEQGDGVVGGAISGTREVGLAVLASTLTTVAVFLPIVFVEGIAGEFFRDQALAVVFSLCAALVVALLLIPMLASRRFSISQTTADGADAIAPWRLDSFVSVQSMRRALGARGLARIVMPLVLLVEAVRFLAELALRIVLLSLFGVLVGLAALVKVLAKLASLVAAPLLWCFDKGYSGVERIYSLALGGALRLRFLVLLMGIGLTVWSTLRAGELGIELVPKVHQGEFTVETQLEVGSPLESTDRVGRDVEVAVRQALESEGIGLIGISSSAGVARDVISKAGDGKHTSRITVRLGRTRDIAATERRAIAAIRERLADLPEVGAPVFTRPSLFTTRTALEVEVVGNELESIYAVAGDLEVAMREMPGLTDIQSSHRSGHPELVIVPDRDRLAVYGLNAGEVARLVRDKIQGTVSTRVTRGDRKVEVLVRTPEDEVDEREEIMNLRVNPSGRRPIPLGTVADVRQRPGPAEIRRVRGQRAVVLSAEVANLDLRGARDRIEAAADALRRRAPERFEGVVVRVAGQSAESDQSLASMLFALAVAVFLVYIVMASQFESFLHPLVILFTIPMALIGVVVALELLAIKLSIIVLIGVVLLAGIVVNNAIVFVDCVNQRRRDGMMRDAAIREAGRLRLRPILMTTATTILGLLPLAMGVGEGAEIRAPMAVTVIAGLTSSTLLTLIVVPVVYSLVSRKGPINVAEEAA